MEETSPPVNKLSFKDRFQSLLAEWGPLFVVVWFGLFAIVLMGFVLAIKFGFKSESTAGEMGILGAAYIATQLTKPLRIAATVIITPALGAFLKRFRRSKEPHAGGSEPQVAPPRADASDASAALSERPSEQR